MLGAVVSTPYLAMKFPLWDIIIVHRDQKMTKKCYMTSLLLLFPLLNTNTIKRTKLTKAIVGEDLDPWVGNDARIEPVGETRHFALAYEQGMKIGMMVREEREYLIGRTELFAWTKVDLLGVDLRVASHQLSTFMEVNTISQKKRKLGEERRQVANAKVKNYFRQGPLKK